MILIKFSGNVGDLEGYHPKFFGANQLWGFCPRGRQSRNFGTPRRHNRTPQAAGFWRKRYPFGFPTVVFEPRSLGRTPEFWRIFQNFGKFGGYPNGGTLAEETVRRISGPKIAFDSGGPVGWLRLYGVEIDWIGVPQKIAKVKNAKTRFLRFSPTLGARRGRTPGDSRDLSDGVCRADRPLQKSEKILALRAGVTPRRIFENLDQICGCRGYPLITFKRYNRFSI